MLAIYLWSSQGFVGNDRDIVLPEESFEMIATYLLDAIGESVEIAAVLVSLNQIIQ